MSILRGESVEFARYIIRRMIGLAIVLVGLSVVIFLIARLIPGDPARIALGPKATAQQVEELRRSMGLNDSPIGQYVHFLTGTLRGDLGQSLLSHRPVTEDIRAALPATLELVLSTVILILAGALPLGVLTARRPNGPVLRLIRGLAMLGVVTPGFVLAILLQLMAAHYWHLMPLTGRLSPESDFVPDITGFVLIDSLLSGRPDALWDGLSHLALPALSLAAGALGQLMRVTQASMESIAGTDFVETLRAFGVPERKIVWKYMLRLASMSPLTLFGLQLASLIGDAFVVEIVFAWPGIASYGVHTILNKDFNAIMAVALVSGCFFVAANLAIDIVLGRLDPRLLAGRSRT